MGTKKPRINVTLDPREEKFLAMLAEKEDKSISLLMRELMLEALERREDIALSMLADMRIERKEEKIAHEDVWKDLFKKAS